MKPKLLQTTIDYAREFMKLDDDTILAIFHNHDYSETNLKPTTTTKESTTVATKAKDIEVLASKDTHQIILPEGMKHDEAMQWLERDKLRLQKVVAINRSYNAYVLDGAYAFSKAISQIFGFSEMVPTPGFFGSRPPTMVSFDIGGAKPISVPWGRVEIPGIDGWLNTGIKMDQNGFPNFVVQGEIRLKDKAKVDLLLNKTQELLDTESVYRGRALRIRFRSDDGELYEGFNFDMAPQFIRPTVQKKDLIYDDVTAREIQDYMFTPIENMEHARAVGVPAKRGILLEGPYGVGKTLAGTALATIAESKKVTYIEVNDARDIHRAIQFAHRYEPAIVWTEDIERAVGVERDASVDQVLNIVDGVDSKNHDIMIVVTTNHIEQINQAMKRPGRFDAIIHIPPPDAGAALKLVLMYGRGLIDTKDPGLHKVGEALQSKIPAMIRECVERAKLSAITRTQSATITLSADDLLLSATSLNKHLKAMEFEAPAKDLRVKIEVDGKLRTATVVSTEPEPSLATEKE